MRSIKKKIVPLAIFLASAILAAGWSTAFAAGEGRMGDKVRTAQGMKVYIDPKTGKIAPPPQGAEQPPQSPTEKESTSTSGEGLTEKPAPGGGYGVDLKGRFQNQ